MLKGERSTSISTDQSTSVQVKILAHCLRHSFVRVGVIYGNLVIRNCQYCLTDPFAGTVPCILIDDSGPQPSCAISLSSQKEYA